MKRQQLDSFKLLEMLLMLSFAVTVPYDEETGGFIPLNKRDHKRAASLLFFYPLDNVRIYATLVVYEAQLTLG